MLFFLFLHLLFHNENIYLLIEFLHLGMWVKGCREFPHENLKSAFLSDHRKKCARRMDWIFYTLLTTVEPLLPIQGNFEKKRIFEQPQEKEET